MDDADEADAGSSTAGDTIGPELSALDFGRLEPADEEVPLHVQPKHQSQQSHVHYSGREGPSPRTGIKLHKLKLARLSHLDDGTKAKVSRSVQTSHVKTWLHAHGYVVKADKLHPAVARIIEEWFSLVDQDGSRTLEHHELLAALKEAQIPCSDATIKEMIGMMDMNKDGVIDWDEFEVFMTEEFAAGKSLLSGEYLLPSGTSLNFGVMIGKLKRNKLLRDIMEDPGRRNRWASIASNPDALGRELAVMQEAVEATSITLEHLKRSEEAKRGVAGAGAGGGGGDTAQSQVTAALVRAMEESRRAAQAVEPVRSLAEKIRAGVLTPPGPELQPRRDCLGSLPLPEQILLASPGLSPARTPRGRAACPDPTASPRTPTGSEGGASACSSLEPFMQMQVQQMQMHASAPAGGGGRGDQVDAAGPGPPDGGGSGGALPAGMPKFGVSASAPPLGPGSALSYNVSAVTQYLPSQSQQSSYGTPPPLLTPFASTPLDWWAGQGARDTPSQYKGSGSGVFAASTPPPPTAYGSRRPFDAAAARLQKPATAMAVYGSRRPSDGPPPPHRHSPASPAAWSEPAPSRVPSRGGSGSRLLATQGRHGGRHRSPSPVPGSPHHRAGAQQHQQQQPAPEPRYLTTGTISSRAHAMQSTRVINQVGLMARELRGAPGRYSAEPPGLPAAVLAATRGQWGGPNDGGGGGGGALADRSLSASADGIALSSRSATVNGTASVPAAAALPSPLRGSASSLPVLPHSGQLSQFIDSVFLTARKAEPPVGGSGAAAGAAAPSSAGGTSARSPERGRARTCGPSEATSAPVPMRLHMPAAWASPDASSAPPPPPVSPRGGNTTLSPRSPRPGNKHLSPAAAAAAPAVQPDGGPAANAAPAADKALKPTSAVGRSRAGLTLTADDGASGSGSGDGGGVSGGASTQRAGSSAGRRPVPPLWASGIAWGSPAAALGYRPGTAAVGAGKAGFGGADAPLASAARAPAPGPPPPGNPAAGSWLYGSDEGVSVLDRSASLSAAPPSPDGRTNDGAGASASAGAGASGRATGGSPGRAALALIGPLEASPRSRGRGPLAARGDKEDATGDPSWQAAAASLLQLRIAKQLSVI
ncbi:hypothetical protein PLESTM_001470500 [Pleodorina starrii]|nr:hypothetical protein PLESTM_001470500 [Pleodorina starrii]